MRGIFRGMPAVVAIVLASLSACSQDASFIENAVQDAATSGDLTRQTCDGSVPSAECLVAREQLAIEPSQDEMRVGQTHAFRAYVVTQDGKRKDVTDAVSWSAVPREAARVNGKGELTALSPSSIKIAADLGSMNAAAAVKIAADDRVKNPFVHVFFQRKEDSATVPAGLLSDVEWESEDVKACELRVNDKEMDRRLSGVYQVSVSQDSKIEVLCQTESGDEISDSIDVKVTKPSVSLTGNGIMGSVVVAASSEVQLKWWSANSSRCELKSGTNPLSSAKDGVFNLMASNGQNIVATCYDDAGNSASSALAIAIVHQSQFKFAAGHAEMIEGSTASRPVSIIFALDVTGSMAAQIESVKTGVKDFVSELTKKGFKPLIGVIPFRDKVPVAGNNGDVMEGRLELTDDVELVKSFVGTLKASAGGDANEASLGAVREALLSLREIDKRPDAIKMIMLVTDQPGHHGENTKDCDLTPTINQFAALSDLEQKQYKLFYSSPATGSVCGGFASGQIQLNQLRSQILTAEAIVEKRGGLIPWPFAATNLVNDVVTMLVKVTPAIELACLNKTVDVSLSGASLFKKNTDLSSEFTQYEAGMPVSLSRTLSEAEFEGINAGGGGINIERCCVSRAAAQAGDFGSCLRTVTVSNVPFTVENAPATLED